MAELKKDWILSPEAFQRLLHWLDAGSDSDGERYLEMRRRLTVYFQRKNCLAPDELADESLNRIARKLEEQGAITEVSALHYCYIVAKFVFLEDVRRGKLIQTDGLSPQSTDSAALSPGSVPGTGGEDAREKILACLESCLDKLPAEDRELILEYYRGEQRAKIERRSELTTRLGITPNALSIRACRIRTRLESCVSRCATET